MAMATDKGTEVKPDCEERPSPLTSLMTTLRNTAKNTGPSTMIPLLLTVLLMTAKSDVPVATGQDKYRPRILQVLKEVAPEVDPELILQQLNRMETDDLVDCSVEVARKYRELEAENENYREECAELRVCLEHMKHSKDEWTKEKQYLLQKVRNEKLQLSEMRQSKDVERTEEQCQENGACRERRVETHSVRVYQKRTTMNTYDPPCSEQVEEDIYDVPVYPIMHPEKHGFMTLPQTQCTYHTSCHGNAQFYSQESSLANEYLATVANGNQIGYPTQLISMEITDGEDLPSPVEECSCINERGLVEDRGYEDQLPIQETGHSDTQEMVTGKNSSQLSATEHKQFMSEQVDNA